jgi:hypothetical protein
LLEQIRESQDIPAARPVAGPQLARLERQDRLPALRADVAGERSRRESSPAEPTTSTAKAIAPPSPVTPREALEPVPSQSQLARSATAAPFAERPVPNPSSVPEITEMATLPQRMEPSLRPEEMMAMTARPRVAEEPAHIAEQRIEHQPPVSATAQRAAAELSAQREALERTTPTAPQLTSLPADARPAEQTTAAVAMLPRQPLLTPLPEVARDAQPTSERRRVELATLQNLEATSRELAELATTQSRQLVEVQPTSVELMRDSSLGVASSLELPSAAELASTPRPAPQATPTRIAQAVVPSVHTDRSDATRSRDSGHAAQIATSGSEQIRDVPAPTAALGQGGGQASSDGLRAEVESVPLARAASAVVAAEPRDDGATHTTAVGQLAEHYLPQRRRAEALAGAQSGGSAVRPRQSNEVAAITTEAALPSQLAGSQAGLATAEAEPSSPAEPTFVAASDARRSEAPLPSAIIGNEVTAPSAAEQLSGSSPGPALVSAARSETAVRQPVLAPTTTNLPRRQPGQTAPLPGAAEIGDIPTTTSDIASTSPARGQGGGQSVAPSLTVGRAENLVPVITDAAEGEGGLGPTPSPFAGLPDRRATRDAELAHVVPPRMIRKNNGGAAGTETAARVPASAFARRGRRLEEIQAGDEGRPSAKTEAAIELGLEFLARVQLEDGHWAFDHLGENADFAPDGQPTLRADAAATGLALLAFLGAGYDHFEDKYQSEVQSGLNYLIRIQAPSGELFPEANQAGGAVTRFYGHGIAALALCEAFGMTGDAELREPAQRALNYIADTQHPEHGGWRYVPGVNSDLSVTGWQLMALRSGQLAGLEVRPETFERVQNLVQSCRGEGANQVLFRYNPWASATDPRTRHGRRPSTVMTAVGLLSQLYLGSNRDDETMQRGADHLLKNLPMPGYSQRVAPTGTLENPLRDTYYWYYATQVMFHMGGEYWREWNDRLHPTLVDTQTPVGPLAGSWNPRQPVPDKWGAFGGRIYVSTMNLLSLEVYYRHLPLYEMTAQ